MLFQYHTTVRPVSSSTISLGRGLRLAPDLQLWPFPCLYIAEMLAHGLCRGWNGEFQERNDSSFSCVGIMTGVYFCTTTQSACKVCSMFSGFVSFMLPLCAQSPTEVQMVFLPPWTVSLCWYRRALSYSIGFRDDRWNNERKEKVLTDIR